jgi:hypothetical protein
MCVCGGEGGGVSQYHFSPLHILYLSADIQTMLTSGYALSDIVTEVGRTVAVLGIDPDIKGMLFEKLSDIEYRLSFGTSEKLQGSALVGAFYMARDALQDRKPGATGSTGRR